MERTRQRALLTGLCILVATAAWPLVLWQQAQAGELTWPTPRRLVVEVTVLVVALCLLAWRHRHPTAVALLILPLSASAFAVVPAYVALYTVAARRDRRTAVGIAAGYVVAALVGAAVLDPPQAWPTHILMMVAFHAIPVALGMARAARLALLHEYEDRATRAETEQTLRVDQARRLERQRIAREMHDVVAHRISLVSLHAGGLAYRPDAPPEEVAHAAEVIQASAHQALEELRGVIGVLRDTAETAEPEPPQPTLADVPHLLERCRAAGMRLTVDDRTGDAATIPPAIGRTAYRVLEEGLTNAAKHAPQAPVAVRVDGRREDGLVVEVVNALPLALHTEHSGPVGAARAATATIPGAGAGLVGLAERVTLASGQLEHGPTDDGRFRLRAEIPWPAS